jgi:hypothetical protein
VGAGFSVGSDIVGGFIFAARLGCSGALGSRGKEGGSGFSVELELAGGRSLSIVLAGGGLSFVAGAGGQDAGSLMIGLALGGPAFVEVGFVVLVDFEFLVLVFAIECALIEVGKYRPLYKVWTNCLDKLFGFRMKQP